MTWTIITEDGPNPHTSCPNRDAITTHYRCGESSTHWVCGHPAAAGCPCVSWACPLFLEKK